MSDDVRLDLLRDAIAESGLDGQTRTFSRTICGTLGN
jgi:hypothetical protein